MCFGALHESVNLEYYSVVVVVVLRGFAFDLFGPILINDHGPIEVRGWCAVKQEVNCVPSGSMWVNIY